MSLFRRSLGSQSGRLAVLGLLVAAIALAAVAAPRLTDGILDANLRHTVSSSAATQRTLISEIDAQHRLPFDPNQGPPYVAQYTVAPTWTAMPSALAKTRAAMPASVRAITGTGRYAGYASPVQSAPLDPGFNASGTPDAPKGSEILSVEAYPQLQRDATLISGHWPKASGDPSASAPIEVVVTAQAAASLHWHLGETQTIAHNPIQRTVKLVGTIRPRDTSTGSDPSDYWALDTTRARAITQTNHDGEIYHRATVWVDATAWGAIGSQLGGAGIEAWYPADGGAVALSTLDQLESDLGLFLANPTPLNDGTQDGRVIRLSSQLPDILSAYSAQAAASSSVVSLALAASAAVALLTLLLVVRLLVDARAPIRDLLRTRGASVGGLMGQASVETAVAAVPAAIAGGIVGIALVAVPRGTSASVPFAFGLREVLTVVICALVVPATAACFVGLADGLPAALRRTAKRQAWIGQAALVVLAAAALVVVLQDAAGAGSSAGVDPLVIVAPLLVSLAGTVVVLRLFPLLVRALRGMLPGRGRAASFVGLTEATRAGGSAWMVTAAVVASSMSALSVVLVTSLLGGSGAANGAAGSTAGSNTVALVLVPGLIGVAALGVVMCVLCAGAAFVASATSGSGVRRRRARTLRMLGFDGRGGGVVAAWLTVPVAVISVVAGTALGVLVSLPTLPAIAATAQAQAAQSSDTQTSAPLTTLDWPALLIVGGAILLIALLAGVIPALADSRASITRRQT